MASQSSATFGRAALLENTLWVISQGATNTFSLEWNRGTDTAPDYFDFTGSSLRLQIRKSPGATPAWVTLTDQPSPQGQIEINGTEIIIVLEPETTTAWGTTKQQGAFDLELIEPSGTVTRMVMGKVTVSLEVTTETS